MARGKVKWFDEKKGYGFVTADGGRDAFAHYSEVSGDGFKTLKEGEEVEFDVEETSKGPKARKIRRLNPAPAEGGRR